MTRQSRHRRPCSPRHLQAASSPPATCHRKSERLHRLRSWFHRTPALRVHKRHHASESPLLISTRGERFDLDRQFHIHPEAERFAPADAEVFPIDGGDGIRPTELFL